MTTPAGFNFIPMTNTEIHALSNLIANEAGRMGAFGVVVGMLFMGALSISARLIGWYLVRRRDAKVER